MASPAVMVVELSTGPNDETGIGTAPDPIDLTIASWQVNQQPTKAIHRDSTTSRAGKANTSGNPDLYPISSKHKIYLELNSGLSSGTSYEVKTPYGVKSFTYRDRATRCESIKVNQVAYSVLSTRRYANFGVYMGDGGTLTLPALPAFEVIDESTCTSPSDCSSGRVVVSARPTDLGDDSGTSGPRSGEHVYRFDLSSVPAGGPYFVAVPGCGRSRSFGIGGAFAKKAAATFTRGLYHQRCGIALEQPYTQFTRPACHQQVSDSRTPWVDDHLTVPAGTPTFAIRGGYHDAGDFDRRPMHMFIPMLMLAYYEAFPTHFIDSQYNIPESGNGIPDFLDEALWGLLLWENLQVTVASDTQYGGVRSGTEMNRHPDYGAVNAATDTGVYGTWAVREDVTAEAAGAFALASRLVRRYDAAHADALLNRAKLAWAYLQRTSNVNLPLPHFLYGAGELYLATGEQPYHDIFKAAARAIVLGSQPWPNEYLPGNFTPPPNGSSANCTTAHFSSYLLPTTRTVDAALVQSLKDKIIGFAESGGYMGINLDTAIYPQGVNKFYAWGNSTVQGRFADVYVWASMFTPDAAKRQKYINTVSVLADYSLGLNPLGMSFVTGLGTDTPQSPLHLDSYYTELRGLGPVPGITIYGAIETASGAAYQTSVTGKLYPAFSARPILRRWGDGWPAVNLNEFDTWNNLSWPACIHGFLYDASADVPPTPTTCSGTAPPTQYQQRSYTCAAGTWTPGPWQAVTPACTLTTTPATTPLNARH